MKRTQILILVLGWMCLGRAWAQGGRGAEEGKPPGEAVPAETEPGIPVTDKLTVERCGGCHKQDGKGNLTRISWIRTTPEGWEEAIKRMVRLNGLQLQPEEARHILAYLAADHGLAPEETAPHRWYLEMRQPENDPAPSASVKMACGSCHAFARPQTWRRSTAEWHLLVSMHLGYFPVAGFTSFHARPRTDGYGILPVSNPGPPLKDPLESAMEYLTASNGLHSAAWSNWRGSMRELDLKGRWMVTATAPGKGKYFGTMTVSGGPAPGQYKTEASLVRVADGSAMTLAGASAVYTGYEWRGRSRAAGVGEVREVMTVSADQASLSGRWFWGGYQEFGLNVTARRDFGDPAVMGTDVTSIRAGSQGVGMKIYGAHFPRSVAAADLDLGAGVKLAKVTGVKPDEISVVVDVEAGAGTGWRPVSLKGRTLAQAFAVYDHIDYIKVATDSAMAHLGGGPHPKGYAQFEALAFNRGVDGKAHTADDVELGPVPVKWSMEEFVARYNDDDKEFVGSIGADGLFTPAIEGPNPQRRFSTNNTGDVWVVANYAGPGAEKEPLTAKGYLVVTVPVYMKWDEPEVAQ